MRNLKTVGELRKALEPYPDDMRIVGYDGGGGEDCPVSVFVCEYEDVDAEIRPPPTVIISTD